MGGFLRNPPQLEHTGTGQFTITNHRDTANYSVFTLAGEVVSNATITDGVVNMGTTYGEYFVGFSQDTALRRATKFIRAEITYRTETTTSCNDKCGVCCQTGTPGNCFAGGACWCGSCAADGTICCGGCYGQDCTTTSRQVKNNPPAGYTEQYGEWVLIENPDGATTQSISPFTLPQVEWDDRYYQVVEMPTPHEAVDEDGNTIPNMPAWDYDAIYFIHYDLDGNVVWMRDNSHNPECFTIVQKGLMTDYEMWVKHLPPAYEGTYEFVISNPNEELVRVEGNV